MKGRIRWLIAMTILVVAFFLSRALADVEISAENFPDPVFRNYILFHYDKDQDVNLSAEEINNVSEIRISDYDFYEENGEKIKSIEGIHYFTELKSLYLSDCELTSLDVSGLSKLTELDCRWMTLESLDVSKNALLKKLDCSHNKLMVLNVENNADLETLWCLSNQIETLNISHNKKLAELYCDNNGMKTLTVGNNGLLKDLYCSNNQLTELFTENLTALETLECEANLLTSLNLHENAALRLLKCSRNQISTLGLSKCIKLDELYCDQNELSSIDISHCSKLKKLDCSWNELKTLDVSCNQVLRYLNCSDNSLDFLDGKNTQLVELHCTGNPMAASDISLNRFLEWISGRNRKKSMENMMDFSPKDIHISDGLYTYELLVSDDDIYWETEAYTGKYLPRILPDERIADEIEGFPVSTPTAYDSKELYNHLNRSSGIYLYAPVSSSECYLTGYTDYERIALLPQKIGRYRVTGIGDYAFENCGTWGPEFATVVVFPETIKYIGKYAFAQAAVKLFLFSEGLEMIDDYAFRSLKQDDIFLPDSLKTLGANPFAADAQWIAGKHPLSVVDERGKEKLYSNGVFSVIDGSLFSVEDMRMISYMDEINYSQNKEYQVPEGTKVIGQGAFAGTDKDLIKVTLPDGLEIIEDRAFEDCLSLVEINIPSSVTTIGASAFSCCFNLTDVSISESVSTIGDYAFASTAITTICIPASVTEIGENIFDWPNPDLTIICQKGSTAETYATEYGFQIQYTE